MVLELKAKTDYHKDNCFPSRVRLSTVNLNCLFSGSLAFLQSQFILNIPTLPFGSLL